MNNQSLSSDLLASSILSPSFSQQNIFKQIQRMPTSVITDDATIVIISKVESASQKLAIRVNGMIPAYMLKIPLPKQLQKNLMFLMTKPILHSMARMMMPEIPTYAGITYLKTIAFLARPSYQKPYMQQYTEKAMKAAPTIRLRNLSMYVTSDRSFLLFLMRDLDGFQSTLSSSSLLLTLFGSIVLRSPSLESPLLSIRYVLFIINLLGFAHQIRPKMI